MSDHTFSAYIAETKAYIERINRTGRYRAIAWSLRPAQEGSPRPLTQTHVAERDADGKPVGLTLCRRPIPDVWDTDGMRYQSWGFGACAVCMRRFTASEAG